MKLIELNFRENPASFVSSLLKEKDFDPFKTLLITPSQRFKNYFASSMLSFNRKGSIISPKLITIKELMREIISRKELEVANSIQKLSMIFSAIKRTRGINDLIPIEGKIGFSYLRGIAKRLMEPFHELNSEMIDLFDIDFKNRGSNIYSDFEHHLKLFRSVYKNYLNVQREKGVFDESFLITAIKERDINCYFKDYSSIVLVSPLSLTGFEKLIFNCVSDKLWVIFQNSDEYDFSTILTYPSNNNVSKRKGSSKANIHFLEAQSRVYEAMMALSIIEEELSNGVRQEEIAVINIDPLFSEMLYNSLKSFYLESNYSYGIPLKKSPIFMLLNLTYNLFKSNFDSRLYLELLRNDLFIKLVEVKSPELKYNVVKDTILKKRIFNLSKLNYFTEPFDIKELKVFEILKNLYNSKDFNNLYQNLSELFSGLGGEKNYEFRVVRDILLNSAVELSDFKEAIEETPFEIFLQYAKTRRYPVLGNKAKGIQIIGFLETRGINFKVVIVPSFNEGFFPTKVDNDIFLNSDIRRMLGLSTHREKEDLEYYYLKRIIDASERSYIISMSNKSQDTDIKSRFYYYLKDSGNIEDAKNFIFPVRTNDKLSETKIHLIKPPSLSSRIDSFSRLDVAKIKGCETRYYISRILNIHEEEKLKTDVELNRVGDKVHHLLLDLYSNEDFTRSFFDYDKIRERFDRLFAKYFRDGFFFTSEEVLLKRILKKNLLKAIKRDIDRFNSGWVICKEFMEKTFTCEIGTGANVYKLEGRIDRIKKKNNNYIIIDYKTGSYPQKNEHLEKKAFSEIQLGYYGLLFKKFRKDLNIEGLCYYDLSGINDIVYIIDRDEIEDYLTKFENHLLMVLKEFNKKESLSLTDDQANCSYCPYFNICRIFEE